jgi:sporulation protein YlmC with PRC-barrel domain
MKGQKDQMKQVNLGMKVHCLDGEAGVVSRIITNPERKRPSYLVVKRGRLIKREIVVPVSLVADVTQEMVRVNTTLDELENFPDFEVTVRQGSINRPMALGSPRPNMLWHPPANSAYMAVKQHPFSDELVKVEKGLVILDSAGVQVGKLDGIIMDRDQQKASFIILNPSREKVQRLVPVSLVDSASSDGVKLYIEKEYVSKLQVFAEEEKNE